MAKRGQKSLEPSAQKRLREAVGVLLKEKGTGVAVAAYLEISQGYLSELKSGGRGGGVKVLEALVAKRPDLAAMVMGSAAPDTSEIDERLRLLSAYLAIPTKEMVALWASAGAGTLSKDEELPEHLHRAAMATVYLEDVTIDAAQQAASTAWLKMQDKPPGNTPKSWLDDIRDALPDSERTGVRAVVRSRKRSKG